MRFVDEATIRVTAGSGGHGCVSFRRERFIPCVSPDGIDGCNGGHIWRVGDSGLNTLSDFLHMRHFRAKNGQPGAGKQRTGKSSDDVLVHVPLGTIVTATETGERIGEILEHEQRLLVARGGQGGRGNVRFKSYTYLAPRHPNPVTPVEYRAPTLHPLGIGDVFSLCLSSL